MKIRFSFLFIGLFFLGWMLPFQTPHAPTPNLLRLQEASPTPELIPPSPADVINAVNNLRLNHGSNALSVHPVLMQVAAEQAGALAASSGMIGHERPCGMTLGQQLLTMGFPLWGDLSQDGYRSENWVTASTTEEAISFWLGDDEHTNTMLSEWRSDIGAAVAVSDQIYVVLETALSTPSRQMQSPAIPILTSIPVTQAACMGLRTPNAAGSLSEYSVPVAVSTARPDGDVVHEVKYGQTLWDLAIQYKVSIAEIKRLNGLGEDTIVPGWKLLIQKAATQPAASLPTSATQVQYPTATPFVFATWTATASATPKPNEAAMLTQSLGQNKVVVAALIISFSVLVAGIIGFGKGRR
jgi:uncharacterized protein YkwD/LysM repeat protein